MKKVLILGITGMLGHNLYYVLSRNNNLEVFGTVRNREGIDKWFNSDGLKKIYHGIEAVDLPLLQNIIDELRPDAVINCIGIIKQIPLAQDPVATLLINALFPHQVAKICGEVGARLVHFSTDCVFSGRKGNYTEEDMSDAEDLYGKTKFLGEVTYTHCITLRTSIIGHELKGKYGLIEWFLSRNKKIKGYTKAIFSGFPTVELGHIVSEYVIPNENLQGLYQVSSDPISKYDLLKLVAERYGRDIEIEPFNDVRENRSLDSTAFKRITGYNPPSWQKLVDKMYQQFITCSCYKRT